VRFGGDGFHAQVGARGLRAVNTFGVVRVGKSQYLEGVGLRGVQ